MSVQRRDVASGTRWDARVRDPSGRVVTRTFRRKADAVAWEREVLAARDRGGWADPRAGRGTVDQLAARWLAGGRVAGKRLGTLAHDEMVLRLHVLPTLGTRRVDSVTPRDVAALVAGWVGAPATVRRRFDVLRAVFAAAVADDVIARSPVRGVRLPPVVPSGRPTVDAAGLARLLDQLDARWRPFVLLAAVTGARFSELAGLQVGDLDLLRGQVTFARGLTEVSGRLVVAAPKTGRSRTVALDPVTLDVLAAHLAARGLTAADADAWVFVGARNGPVRRGTWRSRVWLPAVEAAGLPGLQFSDLRRSAVTLLYGSGVDPGVAGRRLGHSPAVALRHYHQQRDAADRSAASTLAHALGLEPARDERAMDATPDAGQRSGYRP